MSFQDVNRGGDPQQIVITNFDVMAATPEELTYTCTTCGMVSGFCVSFGLISNEFPEEFTKTSERAVWVILLILVIVGGCWTMVVVEPVTGIFQDDKREVAPNEYVEISPFGGRGRYPCFLFGFVALVASIAGLLCNEYEATSATERTIWIIAMCVWGLGMVALLGFIADKACAGSDRVRRAQAMA